MHKQDCENEGAPIILWRIQCTLYSRIQHTLKIELLLTVSSNLKIKRLLKTQFFDG